MTMMIYYSRDPITDSCISLGSITPSNFKHNHLNKREGGRNVSVCVHTCIIAQSSQQALCHVLTRAKAQ